MIYIVKIGGSYTIVIQRGCRALASAGLLLFLLFSGRVPSPPLQLVQQSLEPLLFLIVYGTPQVLERQVFHGGFRLRIRARHLWHVGPVLHGCFWVEPGVGQESGDARDSQHNGIDTDQG